MKYVHSSARSASGSRPAGIVFSLAVCMLTLAGCAGSSGSRRQSDDTNTISGEEISHETTTNINELIVGRVPGITITQSPDGRVVARIRGRSSFTGDDSPLYVVDGMPVEPNRDGSLPGVYVSEIESIRVLKDPTDTARWGMRGAHGVIEVKTKIGRGK